MFTPTEVRDVLLPFIDGHLHEHVGEGIGGVYGRRRARRRLQVAEHGGLGGIAGIVQKVVDRHLHSETRTVAHDTTRSRNEHSKLRLQTSKTGGGRGRGREREREKRALFVYFLKISKTYVRPLHQGGVNDFNEVP